MIHAPCYGYFLDLYQLYDAHYTETPSMPLLWDDNILEQEKKSKTTQA